MIRRHDFNSEWWGADVGIVEDERLFALAAEERAARLEPWAWVEARGPFGAARSLALARAGFALIDTQVRFRIGLARIASTPSIERLEARSAAESPFAIDAEAPASFEHERFTALPGVTMAALNRRYSRWSEALRREDPAHALEILADGAPQGWFLSRATASGLELTLAMLHRNAVISGHHLYHRALLAYAERGARVGFAGFSVANTAVQNIYASLGARFLDPEGCWLWHPSASYGVSHFPPPAAGGGK